MNQQYIYPQNLKSEAKLWLWNLRDIAVLGISLILSVLALSRLHFYVPMVLTLLFGFLSIRVEDQTVLDFLRRAARYFVFSQQTFFWQERSVGGNTEIFL